MDENNAQVRLLQMRIVSNGVVQKVVDTRNGFHARESASCNDEGQQLLPFRRGTLEIGFLKIRDQAVTQQYGIAEGLDCESPLFQTGNIVEICDGPESEDEMIVVQHMPMSIVAVRDTYILVDEISGVNRPVEELHLPEELADRVDDVCGVEVACRDLMEHRGEEEEVVLVDEGDFYGGIMCEAFFQFEGCVHPPEPASEDDDSMVRQAA